jgi:hypothetical protein
MRKPSWTPVRALPLVTIVLLSLFACDRSERAISDSETVRATPAASGFASPNMPERASRQLAAARASGRAGDVAVSMQMSPESPVTGPTPAPDAKSANAPSDNDITHISPLPSIDVSGAMLVRNGQASVEVKGVDAAVSRVRQTAAQFGGFVANTALRTGKDEQRAATLEIRVPSAQFDALLAALSSVGKVESVTVNAEDVAEEYVDLGARAANARRVEARLIEMLDKRTGKLSDVLTVEQELARVRQEAERYEARIRWLERRATLSSLNVTIHEPVPLIDRQPGPGPLAEALGEAWTRMVGVVAWCIASLGILIPLGVLVGVGVLVARRFRGWNPAG